MSYLSTHLRKLALDQTIPMSSGHRDRVIRTMLGEGRGEGAQSMWHIGNVIMNRVRAKNRTPHQVVTRPKQFSVWNDMGSPNTVSTMKIPTTSDQYRRAARFWDVINSTQRVDRTGGATHYYNPRKAQPVWDKAKVFKPRAGSEHVFGKVKF